MSEAALPAQQHPIGMIDTDDLRRSRLTVFFRYPLAIPHVVVMLLWGIVAEIAVFFAWLCALFMGRVPDGLHNFIAGFVRYATRVNAYLLLMANPWPPFSNSRPYPLDVQIAPAAAQSRLTVLFRIVLAIPAFILSYVFRIVNNIVAFLTWFYALFTGRANEGMKNLSVWLFRYEVQTYGYVLLLTGKYPTLSDAPRVPANSPVTPVTPV
jgi:ABC-type multidrug transport system fused ATPase/permease subunit